jgi:ubiquinone biosynthesis protein
MKRSRIDTVREDLRIHQVYNVLLRYGWDLAFQRWRRLNRLRRGMQRWVWQLPDDVVEPTTPVKVRLMLEELGPTYVKMGQIVSSQASVIPEEWETELEKLQSDVPPFPEEQVREILEAELGAGPDELFATFEIEPMAAASTAQIHRATLFSDEQVVVKIQRPGIQTQMKADLGVMQRVAGVAAARSGGLRAIDLEGMIEQFSASVLTELDLPGEAYNSMRLAENMAALEGVHVPRIYPEFLTSRVLVMELVKGVKISDIEAIDAAGLDRTIVARNALRAVVKQLLIDGFFHADPHPGNLLVDLESGRIVFLDAGMVGYLDLNQRLNIIQLLFAIQQQDVAGMGQILRNLSVPFVEEVDEKAYARDFERQISRQLYLGASTGFGQMVSLSLDLLRSHGLRLDPNLTMAIKALMQAEAFVTLLYPEGGIVNEGVEIVQELAVQEVTADKVLEVAKDQLMMSAREVMKRIPSLQEATVKWLDQYQKGRLEVYLDASGLGKEVDKLAYFGRQVIIAMMLVGMIVGSAIATSVLAFAEPQGRWWILAFRLSFIGFVVAMGLTIFILLRLLWRWIKRESALMD